jgi:hypothetical protein
MSYIVNFFGNQFFIIIGGGSTLLMIGGSLYTVFLIIKGVLPVWYRLGRGLSKGRIAVFASTEYGSLESMLVDSNIFKKKNIMQINGNDIKKAEKADLFLVHWKDYATKIDEIIEIKKDGIALIVYAPQSEGRIEEPATLAKINNQRNSIIVNLRGRLLNDILISLITTSYERK